MVESPLKWHIIHSKASEEYVALENHQNQGLKISPYLPSFQKITGKIKLATELLFSRYLIIRSSDISSNCLRISSTSSVAQFMRIGLSHRA